VEQKKSTEWWWTCQTCKQEFTGEMSDGLANAWWSRVRDRAEDDGERLTAASNLVISLKPQGKYDEAEKMQREVLAVEKRVLGAEHPSTLSTASNLVVSLSRQEKYGEAENDARGACSETAGAGSRSSRDIDDREQSGCIPLPPKKGTVQAKAGAWDRNMTIMNTEGQMVSSSKKLIITSIDETFVYDCQGNEVIHFTENMQRGKHNNVERYEIEDGKENSLSTTRMTQLGTTLQLGWESANP
jgi:hypothetical protein